MICHVILRYSHIFPRELFWLKHLMSFYYLAIKYSIKFLSRNCSDFRSVVVITNASHGIGGHTFLGSDSLRDLEGDFAT